ncbi:hypothetical protein COX22_01580 [Candidatus Falkowbacteria bacterium CG23_combo_of_CG06-09_8_20_14_all_49_15]|uniref:Thioredoxin domain-containing protein n=1 Tax=Candidatus Falkowbacteria bacterium CG23_combo_of_CG06-09_8_20_14_all_49_15 TaxID=1974572 RepID=A0A2G9ZLD0_9BACT|nr:MAG: hypothetical protein COX22_01580 [Candidatus Falkowbacteria bacterium CG23_combo_of_CG06-09_8_20_14_all_49_15]
MSFPNKDPNVKLFVASSAAIFVLFAVAYFFFSWPSLLFKAPARSAAQENQFFFRSADKAQDPFITRIVSLKDVLDGPIISAADPHQGDLSAPVKVVVYSDYLCSFCREQEEAVRSVLADYGDRIVFIRKDYPEADKKSLSWQTALAARCAGAQGRYWEYHDYLLSLGMLENSDLLPAASAAGAAEQDLTGCLANRQTESAVVDNMAEANTLGITGVPFVYINNLALFGAVTKEELRAAIDKFLPGQPNSQP